MTVLGPRPRPCALEDVVEGDPVHRDGHLSPRVVQDRRDEVDARDGEVDGLPPVLGRHHRTGHDPGDPDRGLVREVLLVREPVLAVEVAVVGREDDHRVPELAGGPEGVDDALHRLVDGLQRPQRRPPVPIDLRGGAAAERRLRVPLVGGVGLAERRRAWRPHPAEEVGVARRPGRAVGHRVGGVGRELDEEGAVERRRALDHGHGLVGEDVGHVAGLLDGLAVVREGRVLVGLEVGDCAPVVPPRRGPRVGQVAVQVLADEAREVARVLQRDRHRGPLDAEIGRLELGGGVPVGGVGRDPVVRGVPPRQQRRPGRAAEGIRRDRVGEREPSAPDEASGRWHGVELGERLVVGEDHDDVRLGGGRGGRRRLDPTEG